MRSLSVYWYYILDTKVLLQMRTVHVINTNSPVVMYKVWLMQISSISMRSLNIYLYYMSPWHVTWVVSTSTSFHMYHRDSSFKNFPEVDVLVDAIQPKVDLHHIMYERLNTFVSFLKQ